MEKVFTALLAINVVCSILNAFVSKEKTAWIDSAIGWGVALICQIQLVKLGQ